jgi:hypothetical protein
MRALFAIALLGARAQAPGEPAETELPLEPADALPEPGAAPLPPWAAAVDATDPTLAVRYTIERIVVRGNRRTAESIILAELGLGPGDTFSTTDGRIEMGKLRLMSLGYFLEVHTHLARGSRRGAVILHVEVVERGTTILNALHLGSSEATALWGGVEVAETNFLGRGLGFGGGFVMSSRPRVEGAEPALAIALRASGPPRRFGGFNLFASLLYSEGSELHRVAGDDGTARPADFVAARTTRAGGALGLAADLSRTARLVTEARYEQVSARLPELRSRTMSDGALGPVDFGIHEGSSALATLAVTLDVDTRSDPILPAHGRRVALTLEAGGPFLGASYPYAKGVLQASFYRSVLGRHVLAFHGLGGAVFGDAPYFQEFFVGDLNFLLPPRALGLAFSSAPSRDILGTAIAGKRYEPLAARAVVEYAVPLWRRGRFAYRGDAFAAAGLFALASIDDLRFRDRTVGRALPLDLTADLGLRLDTYIGIFTLSIGNGVGRLPL